MTTIRKDFSELATPNARLQECPARLYTVHDIYQIAMGDTMKKIAAKYGVSVMRYWRSIQSQERE
jgi:LysM repeat protein